MQKGEEKDGNEGKASVMKEIYNLAIKNDSFGKMNCSTLTNEIKRKALLLLMFILMKCNDIFKSRGVANRSRQ